MNDLSVLPFPFIKLFEHTTWKLKYLYPVPSAVERCAAYHMVTHVANFEKEKLAGLQGL